MKNQKLSAEQKFGPHLRALRNAAGLSQQQLADRMQLRDFSWLQSTVAKAEKADRPLRLDEFVALCEVLDQVPHGVLEDLTELDDRDRRRRELERSVTAWNEETGRHRAHIEELHERMAAAWAEIEELDAEAAGQ